MRSNRTAEALARYASGGAAYVAAGSVPDVVRRAADVETLAAAYAEEAAAVDRLVAVARRIVRAADRGRASRQVFADGRAPLSGVCLDGAAIGEAVEALTSYGRAAGGGAWRDVIEVVRNDGAVFVVDLSSEGAGGDCRWSVRRYGEPIEQGYAAGARESLRAACRAVEAWKAPALDERLREAIRANGRRWGSSPEFVEQEIAAAAAEPWLVRTATSDRGELVAWVDRSGVELAKRRELFREGFELLKSNEEEAIRRGLAALSQLCAEQEARQTGDP